MTNPSQLTSRRIRQEWIFPAFCGGLSFALFVILLDAAFETAPHPLYSGESIAYALLASLLVFLLSFKSSIVLRLFCVTLSAFYTQRLITIYWAPDQLDYDSYVRFTHADIEASTGYYLLCILAIFFGAVIGELISEKPTVSSDPGLSKPNPLITYFGFTVPFERLTRLVLLFIVPLLIAKLAALSIGIGLTGIIYDPTETSLMWFLNTGDALSPFVIFSLIYFRKNDNNLVLGKWAFALIIISGLLTSSKGFVLSLVLSWYLICSLLGRQLPKGFFLFVVIITIFSIFIFFPLMTIVRGLLISEAFSVDSDYFTNLLGTLLSFLGRLGGFDWLNLWVSVPSNLIPPNASPISEAISIVNRLVPGEIIAQPDAIDLSKLQVQLGRGFGELVELGGHAENMGGAATAYIFFGPLGGLIYFVVLTAALIVVERSAMHAMHKYIIILFYLIIFIIGGGYALMHGSLFWFLMFTTFLVIIIRFWWFIGKRPANTLLTSG